MREHRTIGDGFTWVPVGKRTSRFGGAMPPRKPEERRPVLWLARQRDELYLVNDSEESLHSVKASTGGFQTIDDDAISISSNEGYEYENVRPGSAVKVEHFDEICDLDFILQVYLVIQSDKLGHITVNSPSGKGGIGEAVLLWDSGEPGKNVSIRKISQA